MHPGTWQDPRRYLVFAVVCTSPLALEGQAPACELASRFDSISRDATMAALEATQGVSADTRADSVLDRFAIEWDQRASVGQVYAALAGCFLKEIPEGSFARSSSSAANNFAAGNPLERSGFSDLFSLAVDGLFFGSDATAVTVNLNALALFRLGRDSVYSSPAEFQKAGALRRWGGSFTFGEEIPKKAITGFSGVPDADSLFRAVSWDVRVRILGDRDPRAEQWEHLLRRVAVEGNRIAALTNVVGQLVGTPEGSRLHVDGAFLAAVLEALTVRQVNTLEDAARQIKNSWQVTLKAAGQHITEMEDADKWSFTLLADRGVGNLGDLTINATYSRSVARAGDDESGGASALVRSVLLAAQDSVDIDYLDRLELNAGFTSTILQGVIVPGRGAELSVTGRVEIPLGADAQRLMPGGDAVTINLDRSPVWKANVTFTLPLGDAGKIPLSITYTNDSDALTDQNFVEGRLGVAWDFAAITAALKRLAGE